MGKPIKVSDEVYERLKAKAEEEGGTLQAALFSLVEGRAEEIVRFEREIAALKGRLSPATDAAAKFTARLAALEATVSRLGASVRSLADLRGNDIQAFNSWAQTWKTIEPLEDALGALDARVEAVEKKAHAHFWQ